MEFARLVRDILVGYSLFMFSTPRIRPPPRPHDPASEALAAEVWSRSPRITHCCFEEAVEQKTGQRSDTWVELDPGIFHISSPNYPRPSARRTHLTDAQARFSPLVPAVLIIWCRILGARTTDPPGHREIDLRPVFRGLNFKTHR